MIAIIDYGAGNLFSVQNALTYLGFESRVSSGKEELEKAEGLILPGVGAFPDAMEMLGKSGLVETVKREAARKPFLGICLGMQLLFDEGYEFRKTAGLGLIPGRVDRIICPHKIPHMGWNHLDIKRESPLLKGVSPGSSVYFVHSYMAYTGAENIAAACGYGTEIPALAERGNVFGAQFHPEKSGDTGLRILKNFGELTVNGRF